MTAYSEQTVELNFGQGLYTADLPSAIPEGYCSIAKNVVPTGTSLENRFGFRTSPTDVRIFTNFSSTLFPPRTFFTHLGETDDPDDPIMIMVDGNVSPAGGEVIKLIRQGDKFSPNAFNTVPEDGTSVAYPTLTNGVISETLTNKDYAGATKYLDRVYLFCTDGTLFYISSFDWPNGLLTTTTVGTGPSACTCHPVVFFDRMWTADGNKLLYTDPPTTPGSYPQSWNSTENFWVVNGRDGPGRIWKLIPLSSRMLIFTSNGLFSLTTVGAPTEWYLRPLDEASNSNSPQCAFEYNGLVYYVNDNGVFATDGNSSVPISSSIQNYFNSGNFDSTDPVDRRRANVYRICFLDNGMVVSITNVFFKEVDQVVEVYPDHQYSHIFYSRLDNIAWSEWDFSTSDTEHHLIAVTDVAPNVYSWINAGPLTYILAQHGSSSSADGEANTVTELFYYDGLTDEWGPAAAESIPSDTSGEADIGILVQSRFHDGGHKLLMKQMKYAFLEVFFSNEGSFSDDTQFYYQWLTDHTGKSFSPDGPPVGDSNLDALEFAILKLQADFQFRITQLQMIFNTNGSDTFKMKSAHLVVHETRDLPTWVG